MPSTLNIPSTVIVGGGSRGQVVEQVQRLAAQRVLVVTDPAMRQGPARDVITFLEEAKISVACFDGVQPDPTDTNVRAGLAMLRDFRGQAVVAVGGGSPIDTAKVIAILATNPEPMRQYMGYHKVPLPGVPLIAIPTTAGTGSEVTKVAVITDTDRHEKMMMLSFHLLPRVALVDFELTMTMPGPLTAAVGVDTLTHAIEAYVSRKASAMTDPIALSCVKLVAEHLVKAYREPGNRAAREGMMLAATQGGMAFANSSVCLVHGMSRPIGAIFHLPHGLSNAVLLPAVTRWSIPAAVGRYATIARVMGLCDAAADEATAGAALVAGLEKLNADLELPRLGGCRGMDRKAFDAALTKMAEDALASGSPQNNPRVPTAGEITELYREAW